MLRYLIKNQPTRSLTETPQMGVQPIQVDDEERLPTSIVETPQPQLMQHNDEERPPTSIAKRPSSSIAETPQLIQVNDEERPTSMETERHDKKFAPHFLLLVGLLLTIPAHSSECERGFAEFLDRRSSH